MTQGNTGPQQIEQAERVAFAENQNQRINSITLETLFSTVLAPRTNLLEPWLPEKGIVMVFAPRGVGKTHFALGCAYAVATGGKYLRWKAPKPMPVLLVDGEMPCVALQERLAHIVLGAENEPPNGFVRLLPYDLFDEDGPDLSTEEGQAELEPHIGDAALIVIDNISTICRSGKENEAESWAIIQSWALSQRRKGRSILFVHHSSKGGDQRGTSKREDVMDTVVKLSRPKNHKPSDGARFIVNFVKNRGFAGPDSESFEAALVDGLWSINDEVDERGREILKLHHTGLTQRNIADKVGCSLSTVNRTIKSWAN